MASTAPNLDAVLERLAQHDDVVLAYLFGSAARGGRPARDIDEGRPVLVRDDGTRVRREVRIMRAYWDLRPYLDRIREGARARLATGAPDG